MTEAAAPTYDSRYPWKVLGIVMLGTLMAALDSSIVNVSLPAIMADFGASIDDIEWVITGYMLAFATFMPLTAWFRDRIGHKGLYIGSLVIFTLGSVLCGMAWSLPALIVARVLQAFGGGAITPTGMAMISEVFEPKDRARALGYWGMGVIVGPAFGPTLGGWLTKEFGWRSIFMVNLPIGIIGVAWALAALLPDKPHPSTHKRFDFWGFLFLTVFLVTFLLGLSKGEHEGWTSAYVITCFVLSTIGLVLFITVDTIIDYGIMELELFKYPIFSACIIVTMIRSVALFGGVFLLPLFLQQQQGLDEIESGLIMLPGSLVIGVMMPLAAKLLDKLGPRVLTILGLLGVAQFMFMYRGIDVNTSRWDMILPTLVRGVGIGLLFTPVTVTALNTLPRNKAGMASSMINIFQQVGGSLGIAILATVLSHRVKFHLGVLGAAVDPRAPAFHEAMRRVSEHAHALGFTHGQSARIAGMNVFRTVGESAAVGGFQDSFLVGTGIVLAGIVFALLLPGTGTRPEPGHVVAME